MLHTAAAGESIQLFTRSVGYALGPFTAQCPMPKCEWRSGSDTGVATTECQTPAKLFMSR
jgi:hypothetical protein